MKTMYIRYDGWTPSALGDAVSGQVNTLRCSFSFSADWDAYPNRKAIFETDEAKKEEILDENGSCLIPRAVLTKRGKLKISAYGTETGENGELLRYNGRPAEIIVDLGGNVDGESTDDPDFPQIGEAVLYTAQSLTEAQQAQARANIGAGTPYTMPEASPDALGGIKADEAEETDTQPVRIGVDGKLYTAPGGGGADISLGISGASAGQIPKVKAVDASGAPTEWKAEKDTTPFIVTVGGTASSGYTSSHTFDEIAAAESAGRVVMAYTDYIHFPQVGQSLYGAYFDLVSTQDTAIFVYIDPFNMIKYTFAVDPFSISASASYLSATSSTFGGVKADAAETADTQPVRIGGDGKLYTAPGGGGADISLGISGATAGQMAKVKAVDESGAPTAWEAGDAAGGEEWELINEISTTQWVSSVTINQDSNGNAFSLKKMKIFMTLPKTTNEAGEEQSNPGYAFYQINDRNPPYQNPANGWESALFVWEIEAWGDYCTVTCFKDGRFSSSLHHSDIMVDTGKFGAISKFTWRLFNGIYGWSSTNFKVYGVRA